MFAAERESVAQTGQGAAFATNRLALLWDTAIAKKVVMAVTGVVLVGFVIAHTLRNLKIFADPAEIYAYSRFLRTVGEPELGYGDARIVLLTSVTLHIIAAVQLTGMNWKARPVGYRNRKDVETSFAARSMSWGGVLLAIFIVFHIMHFTLGAVGFKPGQFKDLHVYQNVVAGFSVWPVAAFYILAMGALCPHLDQRTVSMVAAMATELFGSCTNHGECEAVCPKEIPLEFIGRMNHDLIRAAWHRHREPLVIAGVVQHPSHDDAH